MGGDARAQDMDPVRVWHTTYRLIDSVGARVPHAIGAAKACHRQERHGENGVEEVPGKADRSLWRHLGYVRGGSTLGCKRLC